MIDRVIDSIKDTFIKPMNVSSLMIFGTFCLLWAIWIIHPGWAVFETAKMFSVMSYIMPEWAWGAVSAVLGVLVYYGVLSQNIKCIKTTTLIGFYMWTMVSICYFIGDWQNTGGITIAIIAIYSGYAALNIAINREYYVEQK